MIIDSQATAHYGCMRAGPPATGAEPQRDAMLSAHFGFLAILDGTELTDDETFCVMLEDDDGFSIVLEDDTSFCALLVDDDAFSVALEDDESFCVFLIDDDEVQL